MPLDLKSAMETILQAVKDGTSRPVRAVEPLEPFFFSQLMDSFSQFGLSILGLGCFFFWMVALKLVVSLRSESSCQKVRGSLILIHIHIIQMCGGLRWPQGRRLLLALSPICHH